MFRSISPPRRRAARLVAACAAASLAMTALAAAPAEAYASGVRVDLRVLVFSDGSAGVGVITAQMDREGVPYDTVDLNQPGRPALTAGALSDTVSGRPRAKYNGVVLPNEHALPPAELAVLATFEQTFGVRQIDAYTAPTAAVGLTTTWSGVLDGGQLSVTSAGQAAGFGYLNGVLPIDDVDPNVSESYGYLAEPVAGATYTPLVNGASETSGAIIGVYRNGNHDELVITLAMNQYQNVALQLGHGLVTWLTQGVHLGYWRNWFSVHVDDVLLPDARWDTARNCTVGDGCPEIPNPPADIRMTAADVTALEAWQNAQGMKLELAYNAEGSVDAGPTDPLTAKLVADRAQFRWLNHTYSHAYLGCVQDFSTVPWHCATDPVTGQIVYASQAEIKAQFTDNVTWAQSKGITINKAEVVTGEHSGLKTAPQMAVDNPNLAPALAQAAITVLASDASREPAPRSVGAARTVPRHPMNIFYNVATKAEEVDEYNWIYTSVADGGSGICENNPSSTCIEPLDTVTGFDSYIVPIETRIAYGHIIGGSPAPHYVHQSNITEDRIVYPVLDSILATYRAAFTTATPIVVPRMSEVATLQSQQAAWRTAVAARSVEAYLLNGRVTVVNHGSTVAVPITVPANTQVVMLSILGLEILTGPYGAVYGPERSGWTSLSGNGQQLLRLP
ncbi:hypothetical protein F4553_006320 [Allocatelliglobosispora scoriae]|uniref:Uncharacterized protein n=1 Tax=Allocatelliglobosispora scoriae TaxID=643052 RepID=A0A841BZ76_9ACTN|nr:hypothetical protein [Allocatelliglobosispora scoriae]MBB5872886.1 hypothetical protein [Allocatelliglobosispora scoriae]